MSCRVPDELDPADLELHLALVLVPPYHDVEPLRDHRLPHGVLAASALGAVLVKNENVEEALASVLDARPHEGHLLLRPHTVEPLVANVAEPVKRQLRVPFAHQYRLDTDLVDLLKDTSETVVVGVNDVVHRRHKVCDDVG